MTIQTNTNLPIGVFDSGVGGLTVLKALREVLPNENYVYLGDTARLPYGTKSPASISRYACQAATQLQNSGIKLLVVACNTASAVALEALRKQMHPLPVVGVVEPGAQAAVEARPHAAHLVLATEATVRLGAYREAILARDPDATVRELPCELLVALAEEGWTNGEIAETIIRRYLSQVSDYEPDSVILGCTHFPLLRDAIASVAGADVAIVDSAATTARVTSQVLESRSLCNESSAAGELKLTATDGAMRFARVGGRFLGQVLSASDITLIDL